MSTIDHTTRTAAERLADQIAAKAAELADTAADADDRWDRLEELVLCVESTTYAGQPGADGAPIVGVEFSLCLGGPTVRAHIDGHGPRWTGTLSGSWGQDTAQGTMSDEAAAMLAQWVGADQ